MDDPRHSRIRKVVARAFSPRLLAKLETDLARRAERIVDDVLSTGGGDFVTQVAQRLPIQVISEPAQFELPVTDLSHLQGGEREEEALRPVIEALGGEVAEYYSGVREGKNIELVIYSAPVKCLAVRMRAVEMSEEEVGLISCLCKPTLGK